MARLALGVAGAFIGNLIAPGGAGARWGWMIGSMIGGVVDPQVIRNDGPRLADLKVQVSSWGVNIPRYYGRYRGAGNVIWSTEIRETATTTEDDGKGGPSVENTTYSYSVNLAVALCEGEIAGIRKIWADGRLIYNAGSDAEAETVAQSLSFSAGFKVYGGSQSQLPDPTMEADKGAGNVSAYRGLAYIVFEGFQLGNYGNRIPNFEFEVIKDGAITLGGKGQLAVESYTQTDNSYFSTAVTYADSESVWRYQGQWDTNYDRPFLINVYQHLMDGTALQKTTLTVRGSGQAYLARINTDTNGCAVITSSNLEMYFISPAVEYVYTLPSSIGGSQVKVAKKGSYIAAASSMHSNPIFVWEFIKGGFQSDNPPLAAIASVAGKSFVGLDIIDNTLYAAALVGGALWIERYSLLTFTLVSSFDTGIATADCFVAVGDDEFYIYDGVSIYLVTSSGNNNLGAAQKPTGSQVDSIDFQNYRGMFFVSAGQSGEDDVTDIYAFEISSNTAELSDIVSDECERSGLSTADVDVSALTDDVIGYAVTRQSHARANIEQLRQAFYFDAVETDSKIKFVKRGGAVAVTVPYDDLAAHEPGGHAPNPLDIRRMQEVELPQQVSIKFANVDGDYQIGTEKSSRLVTASKNQVSIDLAIAMTPDKAAQVSDVLLFDAHATRTPIKFSTTKKYAKYQPADIFVLQAPTASYRVRIVKKDESGPLINWECVTDDSTIYTSSATGGTSGQTQTQIVSPGPTNAVFMDIPLIRDDDDNAGLYVAMGGYKSAWYGAALFRSTDDSAFNNVASVSNNATIGACGTTLGNWAGGNFFDEANTLDVTLYSGSLSSATHDQVLNGANAALVGSEIIQFKNAVLIGANQYRLSGLLRGRRGTEQHQSTHVASEQFVLFSVAGIARPVETAASIGAIRYYKPVSFGRTQTQTSSLQFTNSATGLKPYSPVNLSGGKQTNGDFTIAWHRRTRVDGGWRDSVDAALGEDSQSYEVDIMDGATVKRTLTSASALVTYGAAQQVSDWGFSKNSISVNVYQVSAAVGRGFPLFGTVIASSSDLYRAYVVLHLHFDGENGATTFTDSTGKAVTAHGNAQISTSGAKFGSGCGLFDGSGDYLTVPYSSDFDLTSVDFTIEFEYQPASVAAQQIYMQRSSQTAYGLVIQLTAANKIRFAAGDSSGAAFEVDITCITSLAIGTYYHIAAVRNGSNFELFIDGQSEGVTTYSGAIYINSSGPVIGVTNDLSSGINGRLDELRVTKGVARYTDNFDPPAEAFTDY